MVANIMLCIHLMFKLLKMVFDSLKSPNPNYLVFKMWQYFIQ